MILLKRKINWTKENIYIYRAKKDNTSQIMIEVRG